MDRKKSEILAAKLNGRAKNAFNKGRRVLRELAIGDRENPEPHNGEGKEMGQNGCDHEDPKGQTL